METLLCLIPLISYVSSLCFQAYIEYQASSPPIPVKVGNREKIFNVHCSLLKRSEFFRAALEPDAFIEGPEQVVRLPVDGPLIFACYFERLYRGVAMDPGQVLFQALRKNTCPDQDATEGMTMEDLERHSNMGDVNGEDYKQGTPRLAGDSGRRYSFPLQFACYVFGGKDLNEEFKTHIAKEISSTGRKWYKYLNVETIEHLYEKTVSKDDPLRAYCMRTLFSRTSISQALEDERFLELMARGDADER